MNLLIWVLLALMALLGAVMLWMRRGVVNMNAAEVQRRRAAKDKLVIVDVRGPEEYASGHIPGAVSIPLPELEQAAAKLNPGAEMVLVCARGSRSLVAYQKLRAKGFSRLHSMPGGMSAWQGPVDRK